MKNLLMKLTIMMCITSILGVFTGCSSMIVENTQLDSSKEVNIKENGKLIEGLDSDNLPEECFAYPPSYEKYEKLMTYIMDLDSALNIDIKYIALDFDFEISEESKQYTFDALSKYEVEIFESEFEMLLDPEYSDDNGNLYGIYINFNSIVVSDNETISFTKYRSGLGSISTEVIFEMNENGEWEIIESDAPAVSS